MAKYLHNYAITLDATNYQSAVASCIGSSDSQQSEYVIAKKENISILDTTTL